MLVSENANYTGFDRLLSRLKRDNTEHCNLPICNPRTEPCNLYQATTVAIDGPAASGKTAVGKLTSKQLDYRFLDTGSMYRAVTLEALMRDISLNDNGALSKLAVSLNFELLPQNTTGILAVDGNELNEELRDPRVDAAVSQISKIDGVRTALVEQQRIVCADGQIVVVGRDIGTVVVPDARVKVYLTAPIVVRANRRYSEIHSLGGNVDLDSLIEKLERRDHIDSTRASSPLRPADDAVQIDTENLSVKQVSDIVVNLAGTV